MEIRQLKYFLAVVRLGSVRAAAQANFVTQPAVTLQVQKLEGEVGEKLKLDGAGLAGLDLGGTQVGGQLILSGIRIGRRATLDRMILRKKPLLT